MKKLILGLLLAISSICANAQFVDLPTGIYWPYQYLPGRTWSTGANSPSVLAATNDEHVSIGRVFFVGRPTSAQTINTTAVVGFVTGAVTFSDPATTIDVCFKSVDLAAGPIARPTGSCLGGVKKTLVGGTDTISANSFKEVTLSTAGTSFTLTQGDLVAVSITMTNRGGVTDSVAISGDYPLNGTGGLPVTNTFVSGAWQTTGIVGANQSPRVWFTTNTSTPVLGSLDGVIPSYTGTSIIYNSGSGTIDYGMIFRVPTTVKIDGLWTAMRTAANTSDFTLGLYSSCGSSPPTTVASVSVAAETMGSPGGEGVVLLNLPSEITLYPNTDYCVGLAATGVGNIRFTSITLPNASMRSFFPGGTALGSVTRTGASVGYGAANTTVMYPMGVRLSGVLQASSMGGVY